MASVANVKSALGDAVPGRAPRRRRPPVAVLMAALAGVVALVSRLGPVRDAVRFALSRVRSRLSAIRGRGRSTAPGAAEAPPAGIAAETGATASDTDASDMAAGTAASDMAADTAADAPVGIGFDDAAASAGSSRTIPAETEEGRPAGV